MDSTLISQLKQFAGNTMPFLFVCSEVFQGDRYILSSGRDIVSLTLNSSVRGDTGEWTCSAQVYEDSVTGMKEMGEPVERTLQLVVGESFHIVMTDLK